MTTMQVEGQGSVNGVDDGSFRTSVLFLIICSMFLIMCCNPWFGVPCLIVGSQASRAVAAGNYSRAREKRLGGFILVFIGFALSAAFWIFVVLANEGKSSDQYATASSSTTSSVTSTSMMTTTSFTALPDIDSKAIAALKCKTLVKQTQMWECRRDVGAAYIIEGGTVLDAYRTLTTDPRYNEYAALLFRSGNGFVLFFSTNGFDDIMLTTGPRPGMTGVDLDCVTPEQKQTVMCGAGSSRFSDPN